MCMTDYTSFHIFHEQKRLNWRNCLYEEAIKDLSMHAKYCFERERFCKPFQGALKYKNIKSKMSEIGFIKDGKFGLKGYTM